VLLQSLELFNGYNFDITTAGKADNSSALSQLPHSSSVKSSNLNNSIMSQSTSFRESVVENK